MNKAKLLLTLSAIILLIVACKSANPMVQNPTTTPQAPAISTNTPNSDWVANFAEPILNAISSRAPDYEDDFSNPTSGWTVGTLSGSPDPEIAKQTGFTQSEYIYGNVGYQDGQYFSRSNPLTDPAPDSIICTTGKNQQLSEYADFVAEFDTKFISGKNGNWSIIFHRWRDSQSAYGLYGFGGNYLGSLYFNKCGSDYPNCPALIEYSDSSFKLDTNWRHFQLIVRGPQMSVYIDGKPAFYFEDDNYTTENNKGTFALVLCNFDDLLLESRWDNLKIWDIPNLP